MRPTEVSAPPRNWRLSEGKTSEKDGAETDEFNEYSVLCPVDLIDDSLSESGPGLRSYLGEEPLFLVASCLFKWVR